MVIGQMAHHRASEAPTVSKTTRVHMSCGPVEALHNVSQSMPGPKPDGFWYGFGFSWVSWIDSEMPDWRCDHFYEVILAPGARVLKIKGVYAFDDFDRKYRAGAAGSLNRYIDWRAVARDYQGIEINPYLWARRLSSDWYYGWDVASGCIWDISAIDGLRPLPSSSFDKDRVYASQDEEDSD